MRSNKLLLALAGASAIALAVSACQPAENTIPDANGVVATEYWTTADEKVQDLVFVRHQVTGICVASRRMGRKTGVAFQVECTPEVEALIAAKGNPVPQQVRSGPSR